MNTSSYSSSFDAKEFIGKRVLVTGGTKGAGKAIAARFQQGGATVIITARSAPVEKRTTTSSRRMSRTTKVINEILNRFHGIDILIHNVG